MKIENKKAYIPCEIVENQINNGLDIRVRIDKTHDLYINRKLLIPDIDQPKPLVPQFILDWVDDSREHSYEFDEWFYYSNQPLEVYKWLNTKNKRQKELNALALVTLIVNGPDAVIVEKEKLYTVKILGCTLFKMTSDNHVRYKLIGENETPSESKFSSYKFEADLTEQEIKQADERLWQWKKEVTE